MNIRPAIICILGPPCSGKSTIIKKIQKDYEFHVISIGDVLRNSTDPIIKESLAKGNYISAAEFILPIIKNKLQNKKESLKPLILDGFPRSENQLYDYRKEFDTTNNTYYIHLQCSDNICISRASLRNRSDDSKIHERLEKHHRETLLLLHQINVVSVNANVDIKAVHTDVTRLIEVAIEDNLHSYEQTDEYL